MTNLMGDMAAELATECQRPMMPDVGRFNCIHPLSDSRHWDMAETPSVKISSPQDFAFAEKCGTCISTGAPNGLKPDGGKARWFAAITSEWNWTMGHAGGFFATSITRPIGNFMVGSRDCA